MVAALGFVLLFVELFASGLHAQAAVPFGHLVKRACQRQPSGTAEQQAEQNGEQWAIPLGDLGPGVEPGSFVAKLFHGIREKGPQRGPGRSNAGEKFGLNHFNDLSVAFANAGVFRNSTLSRNLKGVVHQDHGGDGLAAFGGPEVHWGGWN